MTMQLHRYSVGALASVIGAFVTLPAHAIAFDWGEVTGQMENTVSVGAAVRLERQDPALVGRANVTADGEPGLAFSTNADDGNLAFDKGDLISAGFKINSTLTMNWRDFGARFRGRYVFDSVLNDHDFFDPADFAGAAGMPPRAGTPEDLQRRRSQLQNRIGNDAELLEGYAFGFVSVFGHDVALRLGHQVLNWGESTFIQNGINSILAVDAANLRVPGFDVSELFLPVGMAWMSTELFGGISLEAFYQYDWRETRPDPSGSFFATNDFALFGAETAEVGFGRCPELSAPGVCPAAAGGSAIPRQPDRKPDDGGQGGVALRYFAEALGGADLAVYFANYHSRLPLISGNAAPAGFEGIAPAGGYFVEYPEDIKLYGLSFNAALPFGGLALQGEYSLKQDQPLQIEDIEVLLAGLRTPLPSQIGPFAPGEEIQGWRRHDVSQWNLSATKAIGPSAVFGYDQALLLLEVAGSHIHGLPDPDELLYEAPGTFLPSNPVVSAAVGLFDDNGAPLTQGNDYVDAFSWGYRLAARLTFNNVLQRFEVSPTLRYSHDVNGTSATPILNFVDGRQEAVASINVDYQLVWQLGLSYARYWGGGPFNLIRDRDNLGLTLAYSF